MGIEREHDHQFEKGLWGQSSETVDTQALRVEASAITHRWQVTQCRGVMAVINCLVYHWGLSTESAVRTPAGTTMDRQALQHWVTVPDIRMVCALDHVAEYAQKFWSNRGGRGLSLASIKNHCDRLKELGLVDWVKVNWTAGVRRARVWSKLDVPRLLILAEACEQRMYEIWSRDHEERRYRETSPGIDFMPEHRANFLVRMFNTLFVGWGWRREGPVDAQEPETHADGEHWRNEVIAQSIDGAKAEVRQRVKRWEYLQDRFGQAHRIVASAWDEVTGLARMVGLSMGALENMRSPQISEQQLAELPY